MNISVGVVKGLLLCCLYEGKKEVTLEFSIHFYSGSLNDDDVVSDDDDDDVVSADDDDVEVAQQ